MNIFQYTLAAGALVLSIIGRPAPLVAKHVESYTEDSVLISLQTVSSAAGRLVGGRSAKADRPYLPSFQLQSGQSEAVSGTTWLNLGSRIVGPIDGYVRTVVVSGTNVYVGGLFLNVGGITDADCIARWDGTQWHAVGGGVNGIVHALVISGTDVYVGGSFMDAGGNPNADYIARWDGNQWHALGSGLDGYVSAIAVSGTDVYVGGSFRDAGGNPNADYIARWDGSQWQALGNGLSSPAVAIAISGTDVYVGGWFQNAGGNWDADYVARWDGSQWHAVGDIGIIGGGVYAIAVSGTNVYAGGWFTNAGGNPNANYIVHWNGSGWQAMGNGLNGTVDAIAVSGTNVYVGGYFTDAGGNPAADRIARWDGSQWHALASIPDEAVYAITIHGAHVYAAGAFSNAGGNPAADRIARWDGSQWHAVGGIRVANLNDNVQDIAIRGTEMYVGGYFSDAGSDPDADFIARWDGSGWNAVGGGLNSVAFGFAISGTDAYVGGSFTDAGGNPAADRIARWDGSQWHALGSIPNGVVLAVGVRGTDVYVGGWFQNAGGNPDASYIARWDGNAWNDLQGGMNGQVSTIAISGTDMYVGGNFTDAGGDPKANYIARWDGSQWHALGDGLNGLVGAIAISGTDVYAGGTFEDTAGNPDFDYIARWDGSQWHMLGDGLNGPVGAIVISGTDVYVGGSFTDAGGNPDADHIARWDGSRWHALGDGLNGSVNAIAIRGAEIYAGGFFTNAGGDPAASYIARLSPATLRLTVAPNILTVGDTAVVTATLKDAAGDPLGDHALRLWLGEQAVFTLTNAGGAVVTSFTRLVAGIVPVVAQVGSLSVTVPVTFLAKPPATINLVAHPSTLPVTSNSILTATVQDQYGNPVEDGTPVGFTTSFGALSSPTAATLGGQAQVVLSSTVPGFAVVTATVQSLSATTVVTFLVGPPAVVSLNAQPAMLEVAGSSALTATVQDLYGNPVADGTLVSFTASLGMLSSPTATTIGGQAQVTLSSTVAGPALITATADSASGVTVVTFLAGPATAMTLAADPDTLPVTSNSILTATVQDQYGNPVEDGTLVGFTTSFGALSSPTAATLGGQAQVVLSSTVPGFAVVTATVQSLSATTVVTFLVGPPAAIGLAVQPELLTVGNGSALTVTVQDLYGNPVADGTLVSFTASLGMLSSPTATTIGGQAQVTLSSTVAGLALITATVESVSATTVITFLAGPPAAIGLAAQPVLLTVGNSSALTATVQDQYGNPVEDGTPVGFTTSFGALSSPSAATLGGQAQVVLNSTAPGFAVVTATVQSLSATTVVTFLVGPPAAISLAAQPVLLTVGNSSALTATVEDLYGNPVADGTLVSFTASLGMLSSPTATTIGGQAQVTLSSTVAGLAVVTATVQSLSATTAVTFLVGPPAAIGLTAQPELLTVGNSSVLTATVRDLYGNPVVDGTLVSFTTSFGVLSSPTATTTGGQAQVTLSSTVPGFAVVTATVQSLSATAAVTFIVGLPATINLVAQPAALHVGNGSVLTAMVQDQYGSPVADGTLVGFTTSLGVLSSLTATTTGGQVQVMLSSTVAGLAVVTATAGSVSASVSITWLAEPIPATLSLAASPAVIYANGISQSLVTAQVRDRFDNPIPGVGVVFATGDGVLAPISGTTGPDGSLSAALTSTVPGVARVWAIASSLTAQQEVTCVNPPAADVPLAGAVGVAKVTSGEVRRGDTITYSVPVTNTGLGQINNVMIVAPIPSGTAYLPGSAQGGNFTGEAVGVLSGDSVLAPQRAQNVVIWSGNLAPGATHVLTYAVRVQVLEGVIVNRPRVFVDNAETSLDLTRTDEVVANKAYVPIARR